MIPLSLDMTMRYSRLILRALVFLLAITLCLSSTPIGKISQDGDVSRSHIIHNVHPSLNGLEAATLCHKDYQLPPSGQVTVPATKGFILEAEINGRGPFPAIFDTDSSNFMSASFAHRLRLKVDMESVPFGTSTSAYIKVHKAHVDTLQIGKLLIHNQTFYVAPLPHIGLPQLAVGYELLQHFAVNIDHERQSLTFYGGPHFHYGCSGKAVPLQCQGNNPLVEASVGQISGQFILDTGNEAGFVLHSQFTKKNRLVHTLGAHFVGYNGRGYAGPSPEAYLVRINNLHIGNINAPSVIAHLITDPKDTSDLAGNIGQSVLNRFTEIFDCMHERIYFEKTRSSNQPEIFNRAGLILASYRRGLQVITVLPGSPTALAGLQIGDVIESLDGKASTFTQPPGTILHLAVHHSGKVREVRLILKDVL